MPTPRFIADLRRKIGHDLLLVPTVVVIARDRAGRLLLVHEKDWRLWSLPGGIMEPGETPANAAVREVWEEAGVLCRLTRLLGVVGGPGCETHYENGDRLAWVVTVFAAAVDDGAPFADGSETDAARFVEPERLAEVSLRREMQRFLALETSAGGGFEPATWRPPGR